MSQLQDFLQDLDLMREQERKQRKSNDLIDFIRDNWGLFARSRREMQQAVGRLGRDGTAYSVDALCSLLGIPDEVLFRRIPLETYTKSMQSMTSGGCLDAFMKASEGRGGTILFEVVGAHALVLTDMQTSYPPGLEIRYVKDAETGREINMFKASDARMRMPNQFNHKEN